MGRPRKPTALKILANDQPCRINQDEPQSPPGAGDCPDHLDDVGRQVWVRMTARLEEMGVLTHADGEAIALYCATYSRWVTANEEVKRDGLTVETKTSVKVHPALQIATAAEGQMARLLIQFGMTPVSRSSITVTTKPTEDPLLAFVYGQKPGHAPSETPSEHKPCKS